MRGNLKIWLAIGLSNSLAIRSWQLLGCRFWYILGEKNTIRIDLHIVVCINDEIYNTFVKKAMIHVELSIDFIGKSECMVSLEDSKRHL